MMYPYIKLADDTEVMHSHLIEGEFTKEVEVHFERATENGFDSARCVLPKYKWILQEGFSNEEIVFLKSF